MPITIKLTKVDLPTLLLFILRVLVGGVYIFAGVVKLVDPVGAQIKIHEYLDAFGLSFLQPLAIFIGVLAALIEFVLGTSLILSIFKKAVIKALLAVTLFFTILTFILALTNPVTDCGCFGDALKLTNWQTFYKNLVLLAAVGLLFIFNAHIQSLKSKIKSWMILGLVTFIGAYVSHYSYHHLPILDFRPYAIGNDIPKLMSIPEGAPTDEFKTIFYYSKNGETKQFDESNYPWQDSSWVFVEMKSELIKKGYEPPIHDFILNDTEDGNITQQILNSDQFQFLLIAPRIEDLTPDIIKNISVLGDNLEENDQNFTIVSSSETSSITNLVSEYNIKFNIANADITLLKTIIRSCAGLVILKDGIVVAKYNYKDYPNKAYLQNPMAAELVVKSTLKSKLIFLYLFFILGVGTLLIHGINPKT